MQDIIDIITKIAGSFWIFITTLTAEQITLFSILITIIIYLLGRRSELKLKKLEARRLEYKKLIDMLRKVYTNSLKINDQTRNEFFDTGVSLLVYGSKRVYKKYVFFRDISSNPLIEKSKYFNKNISLYIISDILKTIRHDIGLARFGDIESNEAIAFYVNSVGTNTMSKIEAIKAKYNIKMIKLELFMYDRHKFLYLRKFIYAFIMPIFSFIRLLLKYILVYNFVYILCAISPKFKKSISERDAKIEQK